MQPVLVVGLDQEEAAELFTRFSERAVSYLAFSITNTNARRGRNRVQRGSAQILPLFMEFMREVCGLHNALLAFAIGGRM